MGLLVKSKGLILIIFILWCIPILWCAIKAKEMETKQGSFSSFSKLEIGMKYDEVVKLMGKPTVTKDPYNICYKIAEGWYIELLFSSLGRVLSSMDIVDYYSKREFYLPLDGSSVKVEFPEMEMKLCSLFSFSKVEIGMKYDEVVELMGEPTITKDLYITWYLYKIAEGWYIDLFFDSNNTLIDMYIYIVAYPNKRKFKLHKRLEPFIKAEESEMEIKPRSLSNFSKVKIGMTYDEAVELVGEPTFSFGSGVVWDIYIIDKGWSIELLFLGTLVDIHIEGPYWRKFKLQKKWESSIEAKEPEMEMKPCSLSNFSKVEIGMRYDEVVELAGKPTDTKGSGFSWYRCKIAEGWYISLSFSSINTLTDMHIVDYSNEREYFLY
jgi:outer membrane protein assembly factor BamE (lipoprotein component of BamABCDE complex)